MQNVAVLPKKEWFIYLVFDSTAIDTLVAVLPKKEWFIYIFKAMTKVKKKSQSYPKRRGSSIWKRKNFS